MRNKISTHLFTPLKNVFSLSHKELTPQLVFISKCLAIVIACNKILPFPRKIPYLDFLATIGPDRLYNYTLYGSAILGVLFILFTPRIRTGSFLIGASFLWSIVSCRPCLSNAHMYMSATFLIISVSNKHTGNRLLQAQLIILYFCATINKLLLADWWNGNYFDTLMIDRHANAFYIWASHFFEPKILSKWMGIASLFIELCIPICFLFKKLHKAGLITGILFHTMLVLLTQQTFGPFYYIIAFSYFIFFKWPLSIKVKAPSQGILSAIILLTSNVHFETTGQTHFTITTTSGKIYKGYYAIALLLFNTTFVFYGTLLIASVTNTIMVIFLFHLLFLPLYCRFIFNK